MNKVLFVNKPKGITSFDLCFRMRRVFNTKSIGHTGTLDPNATGVMIVLIDKACKINQFIVKDTKEYIATVKLGFMTDTLDVDGETIKKEEYRNPSKDEYLEAFKKFIGRYTQIPPMTSAIKVKGKKLIDYKREGKAIEIPKREVEIFNLELLEYFEDGFKFKANVSSGTYIRTLMKDILESMGLIGTLMELERTSVGSIHLDMCDNLEDIIQGNYHLHDIYDVLKDNYEVIDYPCDIDIRNGKRIKLDTSSDEVMIVKDKEVLAIYGREKGNIYRSIRGLF
ncbi:MAG: tRNA pseudouridine(55) synthase TruB [Firmicutes bacterium]|nr:tRNA pseudouridine(55) synthase TruB [Bacillota bacterium]MDY3091899.1 tRNA pseudouridine(55) synthase TruB [Erysipelotrichaceae bacterium]